MNAAATAERRAREQLQRALVGPTSLIRFCKSFLHSPHEPRLHACTAKIAASSVYGVREFPGDAGSVGFTRDEAILGAIGECVERYCYSYFDERDTLVASMRELRGAVMSFDRFELFADEQYGRPGFPFARFRPDVPIRWVRAHDLPGGNPVWVPACLVYIPYVPRNRDDLLCHSVSSGQACHSDPDRALLTGLFEVVERDAFMTGWLRQLRLPKVDFLSDPIVAEQYRAYFECEGLTFHVVDLTLDVAIPTYACFVEGVSVRGPVVGMGASTRVCRREAIVKSMKEAAQDFYWCRDLLVRRKDWRPAPDWSNVVEFEDHVRLYCEPDMRRHLDFWLAAPPSRAVAPAEPVESAPPDEQLAHCLALLAARGLETLVFDGTAPDVRRAGLVAPKVLIPGMVSLTANHLLPALGARRLWTVPEECGYQGSAEPNPIPHPFP